ncbi:uncharacterized protein [Panulirus ornatus]|uniref:uncharacterized protein n=1 Tax=Panulirus ornatus TaxID=150431 RepID=UPI003A881BB1
MTSYVSLVVGLLLTVVVAKMAVQVYQLRHGAGRDTDVVLRRINDLSMELKPCLESQEALFRIRRQKQGEMEQEPPKQRMLMWEKRKWKLTITWEKRKLKRDIAAAKKNIKALKEELSALQKKHPQLLKLQSAGKNDTRSTTLPSTNPKKKS